MIVAPLGAVAKTSHEFTRIFPFPFRENSCHSRQKFPPALERETIENMFNKKADSKRVGFFVEKYFFI
jgi:hypothetical protein